MFGLPGLLRPSQGDKNNDKTKVRHSLEKVHSGQRLHSPEAKASISRPEIILDAALGLRKKEMTAETYVDYSVDMSKTDLTEKVYQEIRRRIMTFKLLPGVRISDKEIAQELGLSRTPVRQALYKLVEKGLAEAKHNQGFRVRVFSMDEVKDLYLFREALETLAVRQAVINMSPHKADRLRDHMAGYPEMIEAGDLVEFTRLDSEFHQMIADFSESRLLHRTIGNLQDQLWIVRRYQHLAPKSLLETQAEHGSIIARMVEGRSEEAAGIMSDHILNSMDVVVNMLQHLDG